MKGTRFAALTLALVLLLGAAPALAAEAEGWLVPRTREYPAFTDTRGTLWEDAAAVCCETGLMDGVKDSRFLPAAGLTHAQIIVISARLHRLLSGGTLDYFEPISLKGVDWWRPYDGYLRRQLPALTADPAYQTLGTDPTGTCTRRSFLHLLSAVLTGTGTALPERNDISAVPDCCDPDLLAFYRWGVLGGKDVYGTLEGDSWLTRGAAASMLARLIDPGQRLSLDLKPLELCRELLGIDPETPLLTVDGQVITAGQFMPTLAGTLSYYNHAHFASMGLAQSGQQEETLAAEQVCRLVLCETLAVELGLGVPPEDGLYVDGYQGLTAGGQSWDACHRRLEQAVEEALGETEFPQDRIPPAKYLPVWETLDFHAASVKIRSLPVWGGTW